MCACPNDDLQLIRKIEATTHDMAGEMISNLEQVDAVVRRMNEDLDNAEHEFEKLIDLIRKDLGNFHQIIQDPDQLERNDALLDLEIVEACIVESSPPYFFDEEPDHFDAYVHEPLRIKEISHLNEQDGPGLEDQQPQNSLLKRAQENLRELTQTADMGFTSVLRDLNAIENKAKKHMQCQKEKRGKVDEELCRFKDLLADLLKSHRGQSSALDLPPRLTPRVFEERITKTFQE